MAKKRDKEKLKKNISKFIPDCLSLKDLGSKLKFPTYGAFRQYMYLNHDIRDYIKKEWDSRHEEIGYEVKQSLFDMMNDPNIPANTRATLMIFYLKTQHGWKEKEKQEKVEAEVIVE